MEIGGTALPRLTPFCRPSNTSPPQQLRPGHLLAELGRKLMMCRAIAYQSKVPLVPQGERNSTIFKLAVNLREKFAVTANELFHLTRMWNARLDEPLDPDELFEVTKKAFRFVDATNLPRRRLLTRPPDKPVEEPQVPARFARRLARPNAGQPSCQSPQTASQSISTARQPELANQLLILLR